MHFDSKISVINADFDVNFSRPMSVSLTKISIWVNNIYDNKRCIRKAFIEWNLGVGFGIIRFTIDIMYLYIYFCYIINTLDMVVIRVEFREKRPNQIAFRSYLFMQDSGICNVVKGFLFTLPLHSLHEMSLRQNRIDSNSWNASLSPLHWLHEKTKLIYIAEIPNRKLFTERTRFYRFQCQMLLSTKYRMSRLSVQ